MIPSPDRPVEEVAPASEPPRRLRSTLASLVTVLGAGIVTVTCTAAQGPPPAVVATTVASAPPEALAPPVPASAEPPAALDAAAAPAPVAPTGAIPLPRLQTALRDLDDGKRSDHVRIVWLGDSHTAADFWTGAVRRVLQKAHGNGGPGFVHVGWAGGYRHDGTRGVPGTSFKITPAAYAQSVVTDDGVFGLGGVRFEPRDGGSRTGVEVTDASLAERALWFDLAYRTFPGTEVPTLSVGDVHEKLPSSAAGKIGHFRVRGAPGATTLRVEGGSRFQLFGVTIEADKPGVVLDTVGLNGARLGTALAWDEPSWVSELAARKPDLVVLAYGTNESQDLRGGAERYGTQLEALLARVRKAEPNAECLVVTPIDRSDEAAAVRLGRIRDVLASAGRRAGCAVGVGPAATVSGLVCAVSIDFYDVDRFDQQSSQADPVAAFRLF